MNMLCAFPFFFFSFRRMTVSFTLVGLDDKFSPIDTHRRSPALSSLVISWTIWRESRCPCISLALEPVARLVVSSLAFLLQILYLLYTFFRINEKLMLLQCNGEPIREKWLTSLLTKRLWIPVLLLVYGGWWPWRCNVRFYFIIL